MKDAPVYNRYDVFAVFTCTSLHCQHRNSEIMYMLEQIGFGCFLIVIFDNIAALPSRLEGNHD